MCATHCVVELKRCGLFLLICTNKKETSSVNRMSLAKNIDIKKFEKNNSNEQRKKMTIFFEQIKTMKNEYRKNGQEKITKKMWLRTSERARESKGRDRGIKNNVVTFYKWIVDWNVNMSFVFVIFAHSTVNHHRCYCRRRRCCCSFHLSTVTHTHF